MYYFALCVLMFFIVHSVKSMDMMSTNSDKYGPFTLIAIDVEICRGPKVKDIAKANCKMSEKEDDFSRGSFDLTVPETVKLDELKIVVYNLKNGKKNLMWNYKLRDPCKHYAVGSILALHLKAEKCVIKQGKYNFEINFIETVHKFFGNSFFYGDYYFKVIGIAKKGNIACLMFHQVFEKNVDS